MLTGSWFICTMSCLTACSVGWAHGEGSCQWRFRSKPSKEHLHTHICRRTFRGKTYAVQHWTILKLLHAWSILCTKILPSKSFSLFYDFTNDKENKQQQRQRENAVNKWCLDTRIFTSTHSKKPNTREWYRYQIWYPSLYFKWKASLPLVLFIKLLDEIVVRQWDETNFSYLKNKFLLTQLFKLPRTIDFCYTNFRPELWSGLNVTIITCCKGGYACNIILPSTL